MHDEKSGMIEIIGQLLNSVLSCFGTSKIIRNGVLIVGGVTIVAALSLWFAGNRVRVDLL